MTRLTLAKSADGIYRPLDKQIEERMKPEIILPSRFELTAKAAGYFVLTLLVGAGVLVGLLIMCGFAAVLLTYQKLISAISGYSKK